MTYLLGDMDLCILEEQSADSPYTHSEWKKMAGHDPAGTIGMKPPEVYTLNRIRYSLCTHTKFFSL